MLNKKFSFSDLETSLVTADDEGAYSGSTPINANTLEGSTKAQIISSAVSQAVSQTALEVEEITGITITNQSHSTSALVIQCYRYGNIVNLYVSMNINFTSSSSLAAWQDFTCKINGIPLPAVPKVMSSYVTTSKHLYTWMDNNGTIVVNNSTSSALTNTIYPQMSFTYITND